MAPPTVLCLRMMAKALYLLVGGNEASIVLRQDWAHLLKLWLACKFYRFYFLLIPEYLDFRQITTASKEYYGQIWPVECRQGMPNKGHKRGTTLHCSKMHDRQKLAEFRAANQRGQNERIFRGFNDILQEFITMLDKLLNISHLWRHTKVRKVQKLLEKLLPDTFLELTLELGFCETRAIDWLVKMLFRFARRPTSKSSQIETRLYLLQSGLKQLLPLWKDALSTRARLFQTMDERVIHLHKKHFAQEHSSSNCGQSLDYKYSSISLKKGIALSGTEKRALKRTHQDEWHTYKLALTKDQLSDLKDCYCERRFVTRSQIIGNLAAGTLAIYSWARAKGQG
ncbi:hypothetical protein GPALN_005770 [Globodera pallida]|nr:hypothetical protein GPALN_005770 [Globodera pallida]